MKIKSLNSFQKLQKKLLNELGLEVENIRRTYSGRNQLSTGSWSWVGNRKGCIQEIGSTYTISEILKAKKLSKYLDHINSLGGIGISIDL